MAPDDALNVSVAYSPCAREVDEVNLRLAPGATGADALRQSGLQTRHPGVAIDSLSVGIWGALCEPTDPLRDRDRVELYRALRVDPKEARRQRYRAQGGVRPKSKAPR